MSQCTEILDMLAQKPCTNFELAQIGLQYNARIFTLRDRGIHIACVKRDDGTFVYHLITPFRKIDFEKAKLKPAFAGKN